MRLIKKNRKKKDCGVVAAFNVSSWCDLYKPYTQIEKAAKSCGYNPDKGIYFFQFASLMKKLGIPSKRLKSATVHDIESGLYLGKFFVLLYRPNGYDLGHVIVTFLDHHGHIRVINPDSKRVTWGDLASDVYAKGMKDFHVYEIPNRKSIQRMAARDDDE
jgi:hypothetical protein